MFDFAWSEIALIGVVALVLIGPKDMPVAVKAVADVVKKVRRMAGEFQSHVDEMVKDTSIAEVRQQINEIRNFDIRGEVERAVDADGSLRATFADDPLNPVATDVPAHEQHDIEAPPEADLLPEVATGGPLADAGCAAAEAPAFVPPEIAAAPAPPAFIPPGTPAPSA